jgi:hypothetical protein
MHQASFSSAEITNSKTAFVYNPSKLFATEFHRVDFLFGNGDELSLTHLFWK